MGEKQSFCGQIECISILRFIGALGIALYHIGTFNSYIATLQAGVSLFFCISSFLMMYTTQSEGQKNFVLKRLIRIVPLYWLMTLLTFIAIKVMPSLNAGGESELEAVKSMFFIPYLRHSLKSGDVIRPLVGPGWTLYYDVYFTIVFSLCMRASHKYRGLIAGICCTALLMLQGKFGTETPFLCIVCSIWWTPFIAGICSFYVVRFLWDKEQSKKCKILLLGLAVASIIIMFTSGLNEYRNSLLSAVTLVSLVTAYKKTKMPSVINRLGKISFSFYLVHYYVILAVGKFVDLYSVSWKSVLAILFIFAGALALSSFTYFLVEEKFSKFLKKYIFDVNARE